MLISSSALTLNLLPSGLIEDFVVIGDPPAVFGTYLADHFLKGQFLRVLRRFNVAHRLKSCDAAALSLIGVVTCLGWLELLVAD